MGAVKALRGLRKQAVVAGAKLRRRAEDLIADIERRKARVSREFYEIGLALGELSEPRLYGALGYESFGELLDARGLFGRMHAHRMVGVARAFTRQQALGLGAEKAYALTRYVAATPADELASALVDADATIDGKRVSVISVRQLEAAARTVRAEGRKGPRDPEERAARRLRAPLRRGCGGKALVARRRRRSGKRARGSSASRSPSARSTRSCGPGARRQVDAAAPGRPDAAVVVERQCVSRQVMASSRSKRSFTESWSASSIQPAARAISTEVWASSVLPEA